MAQKKEGFLLGWTNCILSCPQPHVFYYLPDCEVVQTKQSHLPMGTSHMYFTLLMLQSLPPTSPAGSLCSHMQRI
jgi:hypothetical protein